MIKRFWILVLVLWLSASVAVAENFPAGDVLYQRTTLHQEGQDYDTAPLPDDVVDKLIRAGFSAPSGGNQLANHYYIIMDRSVMQRIQESHPYSTPLNTAPLVIVVAGDEANCRYPELLEMDAGFSAMLVQATTFGLSSCVMSIYPQEERVNAVREATGMPETMKPVLMVAFGYATTDAISSASVDNYDTAKAHFVQPNQQEGNEIVDAVSSATALTTADSLEDMLSILTQSTTNWNFLTNYTVPQEALEKIVLAGINTASAVNEQPWLINVVTDSAMIAELADTEKSAHASAMILISVTNSNEMKILDAGLCTQSMQVAARVLGYATKIETAPARIIRNDETGRYAQLFGIPEDKSCRSALFIGYADEAADALSSASMRADVNDMVSYYSGD